MSSFGGQETVVALTNIRQMVGVDRAKLLHAQGSEFPVGRHCLCPKWVSVLIFTTIIGQLVPKFPAPGLKQGERQLINVRPFLSAPR